MDAREEDEDSEDRVEADVGRWRRQEVEDGKEEDEEVMENVR